MRLNYAVVGSGDPLVLIHGGSSRWQSLDGLIRELADRWRVHAPDLRGHGRSGHAPGRYRLSEYADDLIDFLERVTGPAYVFGHSLGGQIAIVAAARRPELFRAVAVGDAPLSRSVVRDRPPDLPTLSAWRDLAASGRSRQHIAAALRETRVADFEGRPGPAANLLGADSPWFDFMAGCLADLDPTMLDAVIESEEMYAGYEPKRLLSRITCPVLLIQADPAHGGALTDAEVDLARSLLRDVRKTRMTGTGHSRYVGQVGAILREFFSGV